MAVLRFYSQNEELGNWSFSKTDLKAAVDKTLDFLRVEDKMNFSTHAEIFEVCMIEQTVTADNCSSIGISRRSYYRYRRRYLKILYILATIFIIGKLTSNATKVATIATVGRWGVCLA